MKPDKTDLINVALTAQQLIKQNKRQEAAELIKNAKLTFYNFLEILRELQDNRQLKKTDSYLWGMSKYDPRKVRTRKKTA